MKKRCIIFIFTCVAVLLLVVAVVAAPHCCKNPQPAKYNLPAQPSLDIYTKRYLHNVGTHKCEFYYGYYFYSVSCKNCGKYWGIYYDKVEYHSDKGCKKYPFVVYKYIPLNK